MITGGNATVFVTNMDASLKFYREVLGLKVSSHYGITGPRSRRVRSRLDCIRSRRVCGTGNAGRDHDWAEH
jgi:catechol 2,3-dioxygenase-like lactoylglutathione lyase family enzyme